MPLPEMPIRSDRRPGDHDDGSDYDTTSGWWEPKQPAKPDTE